MKKCVVFLLFILMCFPVYSKTSEYQKYFEVDLDAPLPDLAVLRKELKNATDVYNPRYLLSWDMGETFDNIWRHIITSYGTSEKRIRQKNEEELVEIIATLPKEFYPYIGPFLHSAPGVPEKILNMPGIKETKNKFPERIAPQLADIEDLEFLSPYLYILLMPEMWPENNQNIEEPQIRPAKVPPVAYTPDFYHNLFDSLIKDLSGTSAQAGKAQLKDQLRTLNVTKDSLLTSADIKAFTDTLSGVLAFSTLDHKIKIIEAGRLLDYFEAKNSTALDMNSLKDIVNPCQRLALKVKWAGLETEFLSVIATKGFGLKEWALTCDKTIKAYRTVLISSAKLSTLQAYKRGLYNTYMQNLSPKWQRRQTAIMEGVFEMYQTNLHDTQEVLKNESLIQEALKPFGGLMITSPISY